MKKALLLLSIMFTLILSAGTTAEGYTCKSPPHETHGGAVYTPILWQFIVEEEIYVAAERYPTGCPALVAEEPEGELSRRTYKWFPDGFSSLVPHLPYGTFSCYTLFETQAEPELESNRLCVYPLEHERF